MLFIPALLGYEGDAKLRSPVEKPEMHRDCHASTALSEQYLLEKYSGFAYKTDLRAEQIVALAHTKFLKKVRLQSLGMEVTALRHARIFRSIALIMALLQLARSLLSLYLPSGVPSLLLLIAAFFYAGLFVLGRKSEIIRPLCLLMTAFALSVEVLLLRLGAIHFIQLLLTVPVAITFMALMVGMIPAMATAVLGSLVTFYMIMNGSPYSRMSSLIAQGDFFRVHFLLYIVGTEILIAIIIFLFDRVLAKSMHDRNRRQVEDARFARRLAMAEMMGKAAHELNNPLAILDGAFRRFKFYSKLGDQSQELVNLGYMRDAMQRLRNVLKGIQIFVEGDLEEAFEEVPAEQIVKAFQSKAQEMLPSDALAFHAEKQILRQTIICRPKQLQFVLQVLLENAIESASGKDMALVFRIIDKGSFLRIELEDNGRGIKDEDAGMIFSPFFSTKTLGKSLGMNLSTSRVFIQEQGGTMGFTRLKDQGVCFYVELKKAASDHA